MSDAGLVERVARLADDLDALAVSVNETRSALLRRLGDVEHEVDRQAGEAIRRLYDLERDVDRKLGELERRLP